MIVETSIKPSEDAAFMPGRGADLIAEGRKIGCFGELHPEVIRAFNLEQPIAALELRLGDLQGTWIA
jgi:phenylalanyl-tRNA synthetase beta chain